MGEEAEGAGGVVGGLGVQVVGGAAVVLDAAPVVQGEDALGGGDLGGEQRRGEFARLREVGGLAQGVGQGAFGAGHVLADPGGQAGGAVDEGGEGEHRRVVVEAGDRVAPGEAGQEVAEQRVEHRLAGVPVADDVRRLVLVVGEAVDDQVFLGGEVGEQGGLGDVGGGRDVRHRHPVEAVLQEERDGRLGDGLSGQFLLALAQSAHGVRLAAGLTGEGFLPGHPG